MRDRDFRSHVGHRVVIEVLDASIVGDLVDESDRVLTVGNATIQADDAGSPVPADGLVIVDRAAIRWVQVVV